ncbi:MAG: sporulation protein Cse60 [Chloroflexi bacterium]|nr:sporulation protein Cse60 [Chloroflexota bacterium]
MQTIIAKDVRVETFQSDEETELDKDVNAWLVDHPKATILDIKFGHAMTSSNEIDSWSFAVMIIYME